jgi:hypothetical protein
MPRHQFFSAASSLTHSTWRSYWKTRPVVERAEARAAGARVDHHERPEVPGKKVELIADLLHAVEVKDARGARPRLGHEPPVDVRIGQVARELEPPIDGESVHDRALVIHDHDEVAKRHDEDDVLVVRVKPVDVARAPVRDETVHALRVRIQPVDAVP